MNLLRLFRTLGSRPIWRLFGGGFASALSTTVVLAVATHASQAIFRTGTEFVDLPLALLFVAAVLLYIVSESRMITWLTTDMEAAIHRLRLELVNRLRHADLWKLEHFGQSRLYASITQNCKVLSANSQYIAQAVRSVILLVTILCYIAFISPLSFVLLTLLLAAASSIYYRLGLAVEQAYDHLSGHEAQLFECVSDLFKGFKEQRLCSLRSRALTETFQAQSGDTVAARSRVHLLRWQQFVFGETTFNLMLGLVVLVVPIYSPTVNAELVRISAAVLFMVTPIFGLMQSLTVLRDAEAAAARMLALAAELAGLEEQGSTGERQPVAADFSALKLEGIEFAFPAASGEIPFTVGPLTVTIERGEVVFVTGGNGAGKSTFLKLLTGLYRPKRGRLSVDAQVVTANRLAAYRQLIAPVFADFYLFSHFYGLDRIDKEAGEELLRWLEMERVCAIEGDRFSRTDLSTGQRKRLALVAALLEAKPILVLDEWAADQDGHFRQKFYREILPALRQRGLTIIAVTHDDRYFDAADRCLHLEEGRLIERSRPQGGWR